jgi:hypothetical protein
MTNTIHQLWLEHIIFAIFCFEQKVEFLFTVLFFHCIQHMSCPHRYFVPQNLTSEVLPPREPFAHGRKKVAMV